MTCFAFTTKMIKVVFCDNWTKINRQGHDMDRTTYLYASCFIIHIVAGRSFVSPMQHRRAADGQWEAVSIGRP